MIDKETVDEMIKLHEYAVLGLVYEIGFRLGDPVSIAHDNADIEEMETRKANYERVLGILRSNKGFIIQAYATKPTTPPTGQAPGL